MQLEKKDVWVTTDEQSIFKVVCKIEGVTVRGAVEMVEDVYVLTEDELEQLVHKEYMRGFNEGKDYSYIPF